MRFVFFGPVGRIAVKQKILLQVDHDSNASTFDSIVAIDAGVDQLLTYPNTTPIEVESLVHGAIFTRGPISLKSTAMFFGGSNVGKSEELFHQARKCFFGPLRVSMMSDPNGSNTTAAAAVLCAQRHEELSGKKVSVLAGTGPVGLRIGQLTAAANANVEICSRSLARAESVCQTIESKTGNRPTAVQAEVPTEAGKIVQHSDIVFAAGAAGVELLQEGWNSDNESVKMAIDINAVPPHGIAGIGVADDGEDREGCICYGAIGVGKLKMAIHRAAIAALFETNDAILDLEEIFQLGQTISNG